MRRNQRWNLRDSVEERNPMLLLGRPLGASAVGGLLSTGLAAAAVSCRGPFLSFPFPLDFDFATSKSGAAGLSHSPSSKTGTVLVARRRRVSVSTSSFTFLNAKTPHGHRHYVGAGLHTGEPLDRSPIRLPMTSTIISLNKLTNATCDFLETAKVWTVELIVST